MTKEEAANIISGYEVYGCGYCLQGGDEVEEALKLAVDALKEPAVDAEPVRHGRWITDSFPMDDGDYLMERCTACGTAIEYGMGTPYCPFCGAKMEDEGEEE